MFAKMHQVGAAETQGSHESLNEQTRRMSIVELTG